MASLLNKERKDQLLKEIITYFKNERDLEIGVIAAEEILDFFTEALGKDIYNKAVLDSKTTIKTCMENLELDLDLLYQE